MLGGDGLKLVGLQAEFGRREGLSAAKMAFYHEFFRRRGEAAGAGQIWRHLRYQVPLVGDRELEFMGVAVPAEQVKPPPAGMVTWELGPTVWRVVSAGDAGDQVTHETGIAWDWTHGAGERTLGEFTAGSLPGAGPANPGPARLTANTYFGPGREIVGGDRVELVPYDESWPAEYRRFAADLRQGPGADALGRLEHLGSTAVPGLPAKPVIDVLGEIAPTAAARRRVIAYLDAPDWEYWWYGDHPMFIKREGFMGRRTHHLHLAPAGDRTWERIVFRDYLRRRPAVAAEYAAIKTRLATGHATDREAYTQAKGEFIRRVTAEAVRATSSE